MTGGQVIEMSLFSMLSQHIVALNVRATISGPHLPGDISLAQTQEETASLNLSRD